MDDRQGRLMMGLAVALLAVTVVSWYAPEDAPVDEAATVPVWTPPEADITALGVTTPEGHVELALREGSWWVTAPYTAKADATRLDGLVGDLARMAWGQPVAGADEDGGPYGLGEPPVARIEVATAQGPVATLVLGREAPAGYLTYARAADGQIVAVGGRPGRQLVGPPVEWQDHRLLDVDLARVRRLELSGPAGTLVVHGEGTRWWIEGGGRADPDRVDDLLTGLADLHAARFEAAPPSPMTRHLVLGLDDGTQVRLDAGPDGEEVPVVSPKGEVVVRGPELAVLGAGPADVADGSAFAVRVGSVDMLALEAGASRWEAHLDGTDWKVGGVVEDSVRAFVTNLAAVRAVPASTVPSAVEPVALTVRTSGGGVEVAVAVGPADGTGHRWARDLAGGVPYRVAESDSAPIFARLAPPP